MFCKVSQSYFGSLDEETELATLMPESTKTKKDVSRFFSSSLSSAAFVVGVVLSLFVFVISVMRPSPEVFTTVPAKSSLTPELNVVSSSTTKPNILFLLIDDLGYGSIGNGESDISFASPFLSSLAKNGIMLTNYYTQEICSPSRAALMTGRYPLTVGMQLGEVSTNEKWGLNLTEILLPQVLRGAGYTNYILGKWNLGHFSPDYLPTARGFDQFVGILSGQTFHWSKAQPPLTYSTDFMIANSTCYSPYQDSDLQMYSTHLYHDKVMDVIRNHNFSDPMYLHLAVQAVHDPFNDNDTFANGIPPSYLSPGIYDDFVSKISGTNRLQYAIALRVLDDAIANIVKVLKEKDQWDNTYLIVASDNGGCYEAGGRNGNLRGCKGSLFEGGVKVDAFIFNQLLTDSLKGLEYNGLMHVSDWFPTILDMADIQYTPDANHSLDGVSQYSAIFEGEAPPRDHILYNMYFNIDRKNFTWDEDVVFGIRKGEMKLLYTYTNNRQADWYSFANPQADDDVLSSHSCPQTFAMTGTYSKMLFNLTADPNERKNLFNLPKYRTVQEELYQMANEHALKAAIDWQPEDSDENAQTYFDTTFRYILPWTEATSPSSPVLCSPTTVFSVTSDWARYTEEEL
jgi:arylsulfatase A-like enzyme